MTFSVILMFVQVEINNHDSTFNSDLYSWSIDVAKYIYDWLTTNTC